MLARYRTSPTTNTYNGVARFTHHIIERNETMTIPISNTNFHVFAEYNIREKALSFGEFSSTTEELTFE